MEIHVQEYCWVGRYQCCIVKWFRSVVDMCGCDRPHLQEHTQCWKAQSDVHVDTDTFGMSFQQDEGHFEANYQCI